MRYSVDRLMRAALIVGCCCLFLLSCHEQEQKIGTPHPKTSRPTYRIGLVPELNIFAQKDRYAPLFAYLSDTLGVNFETVSLANYGESLNLLHYQKLDGALVGSLTEAMAIKGFGAEPVVSLRYLGGAAANNGIIFVRKESGIQSAEDMRGKRMVFVDPATAAGYLIPRNFFQGLGIADYRKWFGEFYFSGSQEDAIRDVLDGQADIGAAEYNIFSMLSRKDPRIDKELKIFATLTDIPPCGLVLRKGIPSEFKDSLRRELLSLQKTAKGRSILAGLGLQGFVAATAQEYNPILDYAKNSQVDLNNRKELNN